MKLFRILSHPYTLIISFLFILISGQHLGGFYALYILLGLPNGVLHSVLGVLGIVILVINYHLNNKNYLRQGLNVLGVILLVGSLFSFFKNDTQRYNWGTFEEGFPMFTLVFTGIIAVCFLISNFWTSMTKAHLNQNLLSKA